MDTPVAQGSSVYVIGNPDNNGDFIVDDLNNLFILHPEQLLSATSVSQSSECIRRSVLEDRVKAPMSKNNALVLGNLLHELFQEAMKANRWDQDFFTECANSIVPRHFEELLETGVSVEQILAQLQTKSSLLRDWARVFIHTQPGVRVPPFLLSVSS
jgi:DNA replication ATP-dependent helicase Dna2